MKRTLSALLTPAIVCAGLLAGCGGGSGGSGGPVAPADADLVVQAVAGLRFDKAEYTATAGSVWIVYLGEPSTNHTLLVTGADDKAIGTKLKVPAGGQDEGTFDLTAGTYTLLCDVPGHTNMKATLIVS